MTKKDYIIIADGMKEARLLAFERFVETNRIEMHLIAEISALFAARVTLALAKDNDNFDKDKFVAYYIAPSKKEISKLSK